jgi:hypothetical protein
MVDSLFTKKTEYLPKRFSKKSLEIIQLKLKSLMVVIVGNTELTRLHYEQMVTLLWNIIQNY